MTQQTTTTPIIIKRSLVAVGASVVLGLLFDLLFFGKLPGVSFPLYVVLVLAGLFGVARSRKLQLPNAALFMLPPMLFFAAMVAVRASGFVTFLNIVVTLYLLALMVTLSAKPHLRQFDLGEYVHAALDLPWRVVRKARQTLTGLVVGQRFMREHPAVPQVVRGIVIALPVLAVFVGLFASADLVFREYAAKLFSFDINATLFWRVVLIALVSVGFTGLFGLLGQKADEQKLAAAGDGRRSFGHGRIEATILFGSLNVLFLSFISIQLAYLFGGEANVAGSGFTYAEYARKGFFELIFVAALSFVLVAVAERRLLRQAEQHDTRFKLLAGGLLVQVVIIMVSAFKRLVLYENAYGFTELRLYSHIFIIWLAVMLAVLLYKIFCNKRDAVLAFTLFVSVLTTVGILNVMNVDAFVARQNISRLERTGKLDLPYLSTLSVDATPELLKLWDAKDQDPEIQRRVGTILYYNRQDLLRAPRDWQSTSVSKAAAKRKLDARASALESYKNNPRVRFFD